MAEQIEILVTRSTNQKSITITDKTDWSTITGTIDSLVGIAVQIYTSDLDNADDTYTFTAEEESEYVANGTIELTFENMFGSIYISDAWYQLTMTATDNAYISNYDGFPVYVTIKNKVCENINDLRTPENSRSYLEGLYHQYMLLDTLDWLDISDAASRQIKFTKNLIALQKLNS